MKEEIPVTMIEPNGPPVKDGSGYRLPTILLLADGRRVDSDNHFGLMRKAKAYLAELPHAPGNPTLAVLRDGALRATKTVFDLTGGR